MRPVAEDRDFLVVPILPLLEDDDGDAVVVANDDVD
jgi:hypothetical protein